MILELIFSQADKIHFDLDVAVLTRPQIQRGCGDFIDQGNRKTISRKVDGLDVVLACIACFNANVVIFGRVKVADLLRVLFYAICARNSPEGPRRQTHGANQITPAALRRRYFDQKNVYLTLSAAKRTASLTATNIL